jgi:3-isopropylmalate/(R)-2-methylmalate dehydratase small subunit
MIFRGRAHIFSDHIDTDVILPGRFLGSTKLEDLAKGCFAGLMDGFSEKVEPGDVVVAGENFGCGSSREHAPLAIKAAGISCVIASSFSRIFYRNAINLGLPAVECPGMVSSVTDGAVIEVDLAAGRVRTSDGAEYVCAFLPREMLQILQSGGLVPFMAEKLANADGNTFV